MTGIERHWIEVEWEEKRAAHDAKLEYLDRARKRYQAWIAVKPKDAELFEQGSIPWVKAAGNVPGAVIFYPNNA